MKRTMVAVIAIAVCACGSNHSDAPRQSDTVKSEPKSKTDGQRAAAPPTSMTWTSSPSLDAVPAGPIRGNASGRSFEAKTVIFEPGFENWKMIIADRKLPSPTDVLSICRHLDLDLPKSPTSGLLFHKPMSYGGGYFQIDSPRAGKMFSWNEENSWALEISSWKATPWDPEGDKVQNAGTAAGRVIVMYKSNRDDLDNTWVAGSFDRAVVRYNGRPFWAPPEGGEDHSSAPKSNRGSLKP